ncbi:helix-turn-helix domain-containing protein [Gordonia sp. L191]|uniref:helix-turn-helix domain-containing protein n=1 Tax=Gordonia sp. L191 TaxID=2982699 RepID=UPI0024BFFC9F|nr:helix-turn-helix domain-containing protein [Gordonia sp. L191]WHU47770.1 helix-turn-helix domain-containing protein [Gordonia sp. L191]
MSASDQSGFWADVVCQAFTPLVPRRARSHMATSIAPEGMPGWVSSAPLDGTNCAEIAACTQLLTHGSSEVRRSTDDVLFVNLQLEGTCQGEQDGERCTVTPGSFAVYDTTRPYSLEFREDDHNLWRALSFRVRQEDWFALTRQRPRTSAAVNGRNGPGAIAASMMVSLWKQRTHFSSDSVPMLDRAFTEVLISAIGSPESSGDIEAAVDSLPVQEHVIEMARRHIRSALPLGRVTAGEVARASCVSVRSLHRSFESSGTTFAECVRTERFLAARRDLRVTDRAVPISEIAARWGFCDSSHLTRTFRAMEGCTPSEFRERTDGDPRPVAVASTGPSVCAPVRDQRRPNNFRRGASG